MTNKTYRSVFTGKEIDEAIIFMRNAKNKQLTITNDIVAASQTTIYIFDKTKYNLVKLNILAVGTSGDVSFVETNVVATAMTGSIINQTINTRNPINTGVPLFTVATTVVGNIVTVKLNSIVAIATLKVEVTNLL